MPELVPGSEDSTDEVRKACVAAAAELAASHPRWIAVAAGIGKAIEPSAVGSFRAYGADVRVALSAQPADASAPASLPLPALVAGWLRERAGATSVRVELVPGDADPSECVALGERLASDTSDDTALLVLGDGSTRHDLSAPGWFDERAVPFDTEVADVLERADHAALLNIDPALAAELGAGGRAPWQVLAGLAGAGGHWRGELRYSAAPRGVGYHVAFWERR
ncbi:Catalytic LigB subunit of aromatic ring-opening dioxygenase [Prauserella marina]|uniref:Catalytic LigB subunit of aromatic ring-opening dioxygenase n=1 Tax=Prauserella marina TaxID=530584 RepID=A0A1G6UV89_9PSEU|nr:catalytic LigB subunit of aromatic ring-opening dioxygenase [Prauserella marina]SDD45262.1 Catalytic LigB subunit of aromatic ring-opening dioxygenase [Prauserella marina]